MCGKRCRRRPRRASESGDIQYHAIAEIGAPRIAPEGGVDRPDVAGRTMWHRNGTLQETGIAKAHLHGCAALACGQSRSTAGLGRMTFEAHKDATAEDCEAVAKLLTELAGEARKGNLRAFEEFWVEGGTEEGDAKVAFIREMMAMRFYI